MLSILVDFFSKKSHFKKIEIKSLIKPSFLQQEIIVITFYKIK